MESQALWVRSLPGSLKILRRPCLLKLLDRLGQLRNLFLKELYLVLQGRVFRADFFCVILQDDLVLRG